MFPGRLKESRMLFALLFMEIVEGDESQVGVRPCPAEPCQPVSSAAVGMVMPDRNMADESCWDD